MSECIFTPTAGQQKAFGKFVGDELFDLQRLCDWIDANMRPEQVFTRVSLARWAENHDYVKDDGTRALDEADAADERRQRTKKLVAQKRRKARRQ